MHQTLQVLGLALGILIVAYFLFWLEQKIKDQNSPEAFGICLWPGPSFHVFIIGLSVCREN